MSQTRCVANAAVVNVDAAQVALFDVRCEEFGITSEQLRRLADRTGATPLEILSALSRDAPARGSIRRGAQ